MEAALVEVATVATDYVELQSTTRDGENILLCKNATDWYQNLQRLYEDENTRKRIAAAAHAYVLQHKTTYTVSDELLSFIEE